MLFRSGSSGDAGLQSLSIRGLTSNTNSTGTVAFVIDDIPVGSGTYFNLGSSMTPDIDPGDLARIEVLKGPQGTLYGADALGGLVKVVTKDPSTNAYSGRVEAVGEGIPDGGLGYTVRGAANIPLSTTFAVRLSGFSRQDPGYIENVTTDQKNVNSVDTYGGRVAALWQPMDALSFKLSALIQNTDGNGTPFVFVNSNLEPALNGLQQAYIPGTEAYHTQVQLYAATINATLGSVHLVSISSYNDSKQHNFQDFSGNHFFGITTPNGASEEVNTEVEKFTQEVRLSSSFSHWLDWLAGAFYTHENDPGHFAFFSNNALTGTRLFEPLDLVAPEGLSEYAFFGDLTAHVTDRFDVQIGGRYADTRQHLGEISSGTLYAGNPVIELPSYGNAHAFTWLVTPSLNITPDAMVYGRVATGYRVGGVNLGVALGTPPTYGPDTTTDYEIGFKGELLDQQLTIDTAFYYIDWRNIQITLNPPGGGITYQGNAGAARSKGVELAISYHLSPGTTLSASGAANRAVLTYNPPNSGVPAVAGDRLPYSEPLSGNFTVDQDLIHLGDFTGFAGGIVSYVDTRLADFSSQRLKLPGFTTVNLHAGIRYQTLFADIFVNNVGNRRGILSATNNWAANPNLSPYIATYTQPRTIGVSLSKTF